MIIVSSVRLVFLILVLLNSTISSSHRRSVSLVVGQSVRSLSDSKQYEMLVRHIGLAWWLTKCSYTKRLQKKKLFASCVESHKRLIGRSILYTFATFSFNQKTPLHVAAEGGHTDTVKCLVDGKADMNVKHTCSGVSIHLWCFTAVGMYCIVPGKCSYPRKCPPSFFCLFSGLDSSPCNCPHALCNPRVRARWVAS